MIRKTFSSAQWFEISEAAHASILSGLLSARRWSVEDLKFQGGTSLHLVYGSPRFSEDLDFVAATDTGLHAAVRAAAPHVQAALRREFPAAKVSVKARDEDDVSEPRNPRTFTLTIGEPDWYRQLKVRVEFWVVEPERAREYEASTRDLRPVRQTLRLDIAPVAVVTAEIEEIFVDKIQALGARDVLKLRDIFDLWWISERLHDGRDLEALARQAIDVLPRHLALYPNGFGLGDLMVELDARAARLLELGRLEGDAFVPVLEQFARWLPEGSPLATALSVRTMLERSAQIALCVVQEHSAPKVPTPADAQRDR